MLLVSKYLHTEARVFRQRDSVISWQRFAWPPQGSGRRGPNPLRPALQRTRSVLDSCLEEYKEPFPVYISALVPCNTIIPSPRLYCSRAAYAPQLNGNDDGRTTVVRSKLRRHAPALLDLRPSQGHFNPPRECAGCTQTCVYGCNGRDPSIRRRGTLL